MKAGEMKQRRDEVITRMLEIEAELKEMKRLWLTEGKEGAPGVRATLEAESAALNCEKNRLNLAIHAGKKAEQAYKQATFTATLVRLLQERDMAEIVREAERISMDRMISATTQSCAAGRQARPNERRVSRCAGEGECANTIVKYKSRHTFI